MPEPAAELPRYQQILRDFEEKTARLARAAAGMRDITGHARSRDGSVEVTVTGTGAVLDLRLSAKAMTRGHLPLTNEIMAMIRQATVDAADKTRANLDPELAAELARIDQARQDAEGTA
ncbi:YbaB/EbfC family nucleoid-associated protein [Actinorhabdospora filicis]|nr:YbaB/EbfC family nucleoid-associated protein [Actinorhabdospora filicis]